MAVNFLSSYKCTDLSRKTLWRVIHPQSQSEEDPANGDLVASDSGREISDKSSLKRAAEDHFDWGSRQPSCFLSAFSCKKHAVRWAYCWVNRHDTTIDVIDIHEIDASRLPPDTYVFEAAYLVASLEISWYQFWADEFIFLHRIPSESLRRTWTVCEIEEQEVEAYGYAAPSLRPSPVTTSTHSFNQFVVSPYP
ncbi:hypothetical protein GGR51DRAFT_556430 [Nemania sp. FL0031]|nr:hypothetical protein GGR51DRAFT_556430 [Nemania sp. FL0031]